MDNVIAIIALIFFIAVIIGFIGSALSFVFFIVSMLWPGILGIGVGVLIMVAGGNTAIGTIFIAIGVIGNIFWGMYMSD